MSDRSPSRGRSIAAAATGPPDYLTVANADDFGFRCSDGAGRLEVGHGASRRRSIATEDGQTRRRPGVGRIAATGDGCENEGKAKQAKTHEKTPEIS